MENLEHRFITHLDKLIQGCKKAEDAAQKALKKTGKPMFARQQQYWRDAQRILRWAKKTFKQKLGMKE
jgi:hypothetical protein